MAPPITLSIHVPCIEFTDMGLFTIEDFLTQQIKRDYKIYKNFEKDRKTCENDIIKLKRRVNHMFGMINNAQNNTSENSDNNMNDETIAEYQVQCQELLDELITARQNKDELFGSMKESFTKIYINWRNIQSWRKYQAPYATSTLNESILYNGTKLRIYVRKHEFNPEIEQRQREIDIRTELYEIKQLIDLKNEIRVREYKQSNMKININQQINDPDIDKAKLILSNQHLFEKFDKKTYQERINNRQNQYLGSPSAPFFEPILDMSANVTETDLCDTRERFRRQQIKNTKIIASLWINDKKISKSNMLSKNKSARLNFPDFQCKVDLNYQIQLLSLPNSIELKIKYSGIFGQQIVSILLPIEKTIHKLKNFNDIIPFESKQMEIKFNRHIMESHYYTYVHPGCGDNQRSVKGNTMIKMNIQVTDEFRES